ncbi:hypothetical protein P9314_19145 [Paenibacillus validus]|uniref:hypothetical protein n=1 Tax=Paenibacillus validus TaxID=44253 RepID=UPI000FDA3B1D|nr:hypothetical protein [Paenibacillus validus]MED4602755.1 hypothetical protein [Paenibacillus validus]MED4607712.1 hypothetical protein [Paenibacillus validus]
MKLSEASKRKGISQSKLGREIHVSLKHYPNIEHGMPNPTAACGWSGQRPAPRAPVGPVGRRARDADYRRDVFLYWMSLAMNIAGFPQVIAIPFLPLP